MDGIAESAAAAARDLRVVVSRLRRQLRGLAIDGDLTPSQTAVLTRLWKEGASSASALAGGPSTTPGQLPMRREKRGRVSTLPFDLENAALQLALPWPSC